MKSFHTTKTHRNSCVNQSKWCLKSWFKSISSIYSWANSNEYKLNVKLFHNLLTISINLHRAKCTNLNAKTRGKKKLFHFDLFLNFYLSCNARWICCRLWKRTREENGARELQLIHCKRNKNAMEFIHHHSRTEEFLFIVCVFSFGAFLSSNLKVD